MIFIERDLNNEMSREKNGCEDGRVGSKKSYRKNENKTR